MAAVGAEVTGSPLFLSTGVVSFFILLLLLSIFLTALCSDCGRRSFELREPEDTNPSTLIRVVKLEEAMVARENPMISEIQNDEKEFKPAEKVPTVSTVSFNALRSHMGAPQSHQDIQTNGGAVMMTTATDCETSGDPNPDEEIMVDFTPWRSHLRAPHSHDVNNFTSANSANIYNNGRVASSPSTNHQSEFELDDALAAAEDDWNVDIKSVYARISKPGRMTTPTEHTPQEVQVTEIRGEESSLPLPERRLTTEG